MDSELEKAALRVIQAWGAGEGGNDLNEVGVAVDALRIALRLTDIPAVPLTRCPIHMFAGWRDGKCQDCASGG